MVSGLNMIQRKLSEKTPDHQSKGPGAHHQLKSKPKITASFPVVLHPLRMYRYYRVACSGGV